MLMMVSDSHFGSRVWELHGYRPIGRAFVKELIDVVPGIAADVAADFAEHMYHFRKIRDRLTRSPGMDLFLRLLVRSATCVTRNLYCFPPTNSDRGF